ncbi:hypothetical protein BD770DRAFT_393549 [Pilaira anomala]|nr:hypothetical protein BD770DRAFT_393549 [Pilaira anomala]
MSNFAARSRSLNSNHKRVVQKKRPSTWTAGIGYPSITKRFSRYKTSVRNSNNSSTKWTDQSRVLSMKSNDYHHHHHHHLQENHRIRHTIGTISTLTTQACSDITTLKTRTTKRSVENIFHTQSTLFLFGFLWFPCWWVGGYWLKIEVNRLNLEERQQMSIHPSLLANGKMCSRILWVSNNTTTTAEEVCEEEDTVELFHRWNQVMSYVSVVLILLIVSLLVWYYVGYL